MAQAISCRLTARQGALGLVVEDHAAGKAPDAGTREAVVEIREDANQVVGLAQDVEGHGTLAGAYDAAAAADSPPKRLTKYSQVWRMPVAKSISGR